MMAKTFQYPYIVLALKKTFTAKYAQNILSETEIRKLHLLRGTTIIPAPFHMGVPSEASNFSLYDQCVIKQDGHENYEYDHTRRMFLKFKHLPALLLTANFHGKQIKIFILIN